MSMGLTKYSFAPASSNRLMLSWVASALTMATGMAEVAGVGLQRRDHVDALDVRQAQVEEDRRWCD